jgi:hypothetical protein
VEEAALVLASFGSAIVVAAAIDRLSIEPRRLLAAVSAVAILGVSAVSLVDGRLGLPPGDVNDELSFASTLSNDGGAGRVLLASVDPALIPGTARPGPGFWYRTLDGEGTTIDEVWLPEPRAGDDQLAESINLVASGAELRPGRLLAEFSIDWVVVAGPESPLDQILESQLDLVPTPLATGSRVFENPASIPLVAGDDNLGWTREGAGFGGRPTAGTVSISVNHSAGWQPEPASQGWRLTVDGSEGMATFSGSGYLSFAPYVALGMFLIALVFLVWGRARR